MKKNKIQKKVEKLTQLFTVPRHKNKKLAYRYLFSTLCALEEIAVLAAERGAGVENQLEDEYVHRECFKQLANLCGGYEEPCEYTQNLIDYLQNLQGNNSIAALNLVAEGWLSCVFRGLSSLCPKLFDSIGEDEDRHNGYALSYEIPNSQELAPIVRNLETLLFKIIQSPNFIVPMIYLLGMRNVGLMGLEMIESHKKACEHMKVTSDTRDVKKMCRSTIQGSKNYPEEIEINNWQHNKLKIWKNTASMISIKELKISSKNNLIVQSKVIEAVSKIYKLYPHFRNVTRDDKIFRTKSPMVAVRVPWDADHLSTIFLDPRHGHKTVLKRIIAKTKKIRAKKYERLPEIDHIKDLLPPSQCPVAVSFVGFSEPSETPYWGWGVINEIEGIPICIWIGPPRKKVEDFWTTNIMILMDHRVYDGKDIDLFMTKLEQYLLEIN